MTETACGTSLNIVLNSARLKTSTITGVIAVTVAFHVLCSTSACSPKKLSRPSLAALVQPISTEASPSTITENSAPRSLAGTSHGRR